MIGKQNYQKSAIEAELNFEFFEFTIISFTRKLCYRKDDRAMRAIYIDPELLRKYGHSKLSKMAAAAILDLFESKIAPLYPLSPKTPPYNQT